jgi:predicted anti-sigma-YlaC factor YlaD
VEVDAERLEASDWEAATARRERAARLYRRARDYGLRGLEVAHPGLGERLRATPEEAAAELAPGETELAYWTAAAWGSQVSLGLDRPELVADLPAVEALLERVTEVAPGFDLGAAHEALAALAAATVPGPAGLAAAEERFDRAAALARGARAGVFVARAEAVALRRQDRDAYVALLERALAVDPDAVPEKRLANLVNQRRARWLLDHLDDRFLPPVEGEEEDLP